MAPNNKPKMIAKIGDKKLDNVADIASIVTEFNNNNYS